MCPVSHIHGLTDAGVLDKNVSHSKDIKLAKAPFRYSPCMSMGKICADLVSQNCFLYSPQNTREHPGSCAEGKRHLSSHHIQRGENLKRRDLFFT